jgi:hypothetical protein
MTRESRRRNLHSEIMYYFLIPGLDYLGMESYKPSGKIINQGPHMPKWAPRGH